MHVELGNLRTTVIDSTDEERMWLREFLSFPDNRARFIRGRYRGSGKVRLYNTLADNFPTGLFPLVWKGARKEGYPISVTDTRRVPVQQDLRADLSWLRWYQKAAVDAVVDQRRGILHMPTGSGKTEVAIALKRVFPCKWLFLVHRASLLHEAANRYEKRCPGDLAGRVGDGAFIDGGFVVATFQTVARMKEKRAAFLAQFQGLVVDECHTLPADSFWRVAMETEHAYYRIGMSGTPLARGDRRSLLAVAALGPVMYRIKPDVLIKEGVLSKPCIRMVPILHTSKAATWPGIESECIVRSVRRNAAVVEAAKLAQKPCLVFVRQIKHGKALVARLGKAGLRAGFVWGQKTTSSRADDVLRLVRGELDVVVCSVVFQEGIDIPELQSVIVASGGKSTIAALQRIGRGMRVAEGKDGFGVWDFDDRGHKWLEKHTRARKRAYASEGYEVTEETAFHAARKPCSNAQADAPQDDPSG